MGNVYSYVYLYTFCHNGRKMSLHYTKKSLGIYWFHFLAWINSVLFITYEDNADCARCRDCGRTVHDWHTDDKTFAAVIGTTTGVWCWDCFCSRARKRGISLECIVYSRNPGEPVEM